MWTFAAFCDNMLSKERFYTFRKGADKMKKALFAGIRPSTLDRVYSSEIKKRLGNAVAFLPPLNSAEDAAKRSDLKEVNYIFSTWGMPVFTEEQVKEYFPALTDIFYAAGTVKYFAEPFMKRGVRVHSAFRANGIPVAEFTVAEIILAAKGVFPRICKSRDSYSNDDPECLYPGCFKTKVGIIGAGAIGSHVIKLLRNFDFKVYAFDKFLTKEQLAEKGAEKATLEEIFANCDIISNHLANVPETVGMIDERYFSMMKSGQVFINTGRGAQIKESAMIDMLKSNPDCTAILDVTDPVEPPEADSPLYTLKNVVLTPHIAGSIGHEVWRMAEYMYDEFERVESGKPPLHEVSFAMLATMT